jgi:hypothetical protein
VGLGCFLVVSGIVGGSKTPLASGPERVGCRVGFDSVRTPGAQFGPVTGRDGWSLWTRRKVAPRITILEGMESTAADVMAAILPCFGL